MTELEMQFHREMIKIYETAKKECNYKPTRFLQMISRADGVSVAKQLIRKPGGTDGFATLWECGRLDLSVEAQLLKSEYMSLFSEEDRKICRDRLTDYGYYK